MQVPLFGPGVQGRRHAEDGGGIIGAETLLAERGQGDSRGVDQRFVHPLRVRPHDRAKLRRDRKTNVKVMGRQHAVHALLDAMLITGQGACRSAWQVGPRAS